MSNSQLKEQLFESKKSNIYIYGFEREKNIWVSDFCIKRYRILSQIHTSLPLL
jgi:hypothetical protein